MTARPTQAFMNEVDIRPVKDCGKDFDGLDNSRARAVEVLVPVGQEDLLILDGFQTRPARMLGQ